MPMSPSLLRPRSTGFHPEAQAWRNAVIANGGLASGSTLAAVSTFCRSIDAAGIRDRFLRLNLFAGDNISAALVPLFRGESRTSSQVGNTTDTNTNFVSGDYALASGLDSNAASKSLNTGVLANSLTASDAHLGVGILRQNTITATNFPAIIGAYNGSANSFAISARFNAASQRAASFTRFGTSADTFGDDIGTGASSLAAGNVVAAWPTMYRNGVATGTDATTSQNYPSAHAFFIFASSVTGTSANNFSNVRLGWYSIGRTFTSAQVVAFNNALSRFYSDIGRS